MQPRPRATRRLRGCSLRVQRYERVLHPMDSGLQSCWLCVNASLPRERAVAGPGLSSCNWTMGRENCKLRSTSTGSPVHKPATVYMPRVVRGCESLLRTYKAVRPTTFVQRRRRTRQFRRAAPTCRDRTRQHPRAICVHRRRVRKPRPTRYTLRYQVGASIEGDGIQPAGAVHDRSPLLKFLRKSS